MRSQSMEVLTRMTHRHHCTRDRLKSTFLSLWLHHYSKNSKSNSQICKELRYIRAGSNWFLMTRMNLTSRQFLMVSKWIRSKGWWWSLNYRCKENKQLRRENQQWVSIKVAKNNSLSIFKMSKARTPFLSLFLVAWIPYLMLQPK